MSDVVSPAKRSGMISGIKGKNYLPKLPVRKALFAMGHRFRLHRRDLPGTPDIAMQRLANEGLNHDARLNPGASGGLAGA
jgi:G:T-mismatch repair DNA endonuclease (very short patch repair protein)